MKTKKKKKFQKMKKTLSGFMALVLVVGLTVAGTLAYLSTKSTQVTNTFTASKNISLGLAEPDYYYKKDSDGKDEARTDENEVDSNGKKYLSEKPDPKKYVPGTTYDKNPMLYNITADGESYEWVAMRVDYQIKYYDTTNKKYPDDYTAYKRTELEYSDTSGSENYEGIIKSIVFDTDTSGGWFQLTSDLFPKSGDTGYDDLTSEQKTEITNLKGEISSAKYEVYIYKYPLKSDSNVDKDSLPTSGSTWKTTNASTTTNTVRTSPLFSAITIMDEDTLQKTTANKGGNYSMDGLPQFQILAKGGAIKKTEEFALTSIDSGEINTITDSTLSTEYNIVKALWEVLDVTS